MQEGREKKVTTLDAILIRSSVIDSVSVFENSIQECVNRAKDFQKSALYIAINTQVIDFLYQCQPASAVSKFEILW